MKDSIVRFTGYVPLLTLLWEKDMINKKTVQATKVKRSTFRKYSLNGLRYYECYVQVLLFFLFFLTVLFGESLRPLPYKIYICFVLVK